MDPTNSMSSRPAVARAAWISEGTAQAGDWRFLRQPTERELRREGEYWSLELEGHVLRLRDSVGLRYVAQLLVRPGEDVHVIDLAGALAAPEGFVGRQPPRLSPMDATVRHGTSPGDAGEMLDQRSRSEYRRRLEALLQQLDVARTRADLVLCSEIETEMEFLAGELARAVGLGGRPRRAASTAERARNSVGRAIRRCIGRAARLNPVIGHHFRTSIKTGIYCRYEPAPGTTGSWNVR